MSISGSNNPFSCSPVVFSAGNSIISLGTITRAGNVFTFSVGFVWKINGIVYQNNTPVILTVSEASEGFQRIDNALLNTSNTIELQQGLESEIIALQPTFPENTVLLTSWNISGDTVGETESPIVGNVFQKKEFDNIQVYIGSAPGTNVVIPLNSQGRRVILLQGTISNVKGFSRELIDGNASAETPHEGKIFTLINNTANPITINHNDIDQDISFLSKSTSDIVIPVNESVDFMHRSSVFQEVKRNWNEASTLTDSAFGAFTNGLQTEDELSDSDKFSFVDTSDSNKQKKTTWLNIKAKLKTAFDLLYQSILVSGTNIKTINGNSILGSGDLVVSAGGTSKRTYYAEWKLSGAMAASTSWFAQGQLDSLRGVFVATAGITPTNNFANYSIQTPCYVLPFNAKIKSYNAKGFTNGNTTAFLRSIVNSSFSSTTVNSNTIQSPLNIADVSFQLGYPGVTGNFFRFQTDTGFSDVTLPKGTEIRLFNFNNNQSTPLQSTIVSIEFEEVL